MGTFGQAVVDSYQPNPAEHHNNRLDDRRGVSSRHSIGDILSKSKQANTNHVSMVTAMIRDGGEIVSSGL